jgi:hypothetical protein
MELLVFNTIYIIVYPSYQCWQLLSKHVPTAMNTHATVEELSHTVLYAARVMSKQLFLPRISLFVCFKFKFRNKQISVSKLSREITPYTRLGGVLHISSPPKCLQFGN